MIECKSSDGVYFGIFDTALLKNSVLNGQDDPLNDLTFIESEDCYDEKLGQSKIIVFKSGGRFFMIADAELIKEERSTIDCIEIEPNEGEN